MLGTVLLVVVVLLLIGAGRGCAASRRGQAGVPASVVEQRPAVGIGCVHGQHPAHDDGVVATGVVA